MLRWENHLFGCTGPEPSQGSVPGWFGPNKRFGFCFQCKGGSTLVLHRPIETTALTRHLPVKLWIILYSHGTLWRTALVPGIIYSVTTFGITWLVVANIGFAVCGWLCVFKTSMLVRMAQRNYTRRSKFVQAHAFSNMVQKPWYPTLIRCCGIFLWLWELAIILLVLTHKMR